MTDSMKFGPEWLRNITQDTSSSTPTMSGPKYQLAEFRYGREEMLALFDEASASPEPLKSLSGLYVDKTQPPLALISVTDEETRMWNRGINSDAVLRANRAAGGGPVLGGPGPGMNSSMNLNSSILRGGRGGSSIDRGRGRNLRGTSSFHYPPHRTSYDEYSDLLPSFVRSSRPFDRSQSQGSERSWLDRNGTGERSMDRGGNGGGGGGNDSSGNEWSGGHHAQLSSSPRKEFPSRSGLADSNNWRKHRGAGESSDSDGWRSNSNNGATNEYTRQSSGNEKWERNSWREPNDRDREREKEVDEKERGGKWERRPWENHEKRVRRMTWDSTDDSLPEWATENPSETGGSFDASGAFYRDDVYSDEEEPPRGKENHLRQHDEGYSKANQMRNRRLSSSEDEKQNYLDDSPQKNKTRKQSEDGSLSSSNHKQPLEQTNDNQLVDESSVSFHRSNSKPEGASPKKSHPVQNNSQLVYNSNNTSNSSSSSLALKQSQSASNLSSPLSPPVAMRSMSSVTSASINSNDVMSKVVPQSFDPKMSISKSESTSKVPNASVHNTLLHNSSAPSLTCYAGLTDRYQTGNSVPSLYSNKEAAERQQHHQHQQHQQHPHQQHQQHQQHPHQQQPKADETFARMQEVADDIVAKLMTDDEDVPPPVQPTPPPVKPIVTNRWYYRDPQGARQGPFSSTEMAEWFKSGYFQVNLLVRRECDETYAPLGDLIKLWGRVPFLADNLHAPIKSTVDSSLGIGGVKGASGAPSPLMNCIKPPEAAPFAAGLGVPQMEDEYQFQYRQLMLRQQAVAFQNVLSKLSQTERWNSLTTIQQQELIMQHMNNAEMGVMPPLHNAGFVVGPEAMQAPPPQPQPQPAQQQTSMPPNNPLMSLLAQMGLPVSHDPPTPAQMSPIQQVPPPQPPQSLHHHQPPPTQPQAQSTLDPWQQFIQKLNTNNLGGFSSPPHHLMQQPPPPQPQAPPPQPQSPQQPLSASLHSHNHTHQQHSHVPHGHPPTSLLAGMPDDVGQGEMDPVQRLLRQLGIQHQVPPSQQQQQQQQPQPQSANKVDSLWGGLNSNLGSSQVSSWMPSPTQPLPNQTSSIWGDVPPKVMKTEQEILKEQLQKAEESKKLEKLRKQQLQEKEKQKKLEEETNKKATEDKKKKSEEKKKKDTDTKEKKKQEDDKKKRLDEETKKKEEDKKRKDEDKKKKEEDKKKKEEEKLKKENKEKKKKQHEEDKEKKRQDDDKKKKDSDRRKDDEQKEGGKRIDSDKSPDQKAPVKQPWSNQTISTPSLADIQKIEREKKIKQQIKEQQQLAEMAAARNANPEPPPTGFQLKWAETKNPPTVVKSLAEIQAEEQKQLAKQLERERAERLQQAKEVQIPASSCIWANQNLTWNTNQHNSVWGNSTPSTNSSGFWENMANSTNVTNSTSNAKANTNTGNTKAVSVNSVQKSPKSNSNLSVVNVVNSNTSNSNSTAMSNNKNTNANAVTNSVSSAKTTKGNKQKEALASPKTTPPRPAKNDEFSQWCNKAISNLKTSVDVPTFVGFLRDIESPFEVKDYCKAYLGESKEAGEFARQFIERRSKWRAKMTNKNTPADDISAPAPALPAEFTEVKGKNKKTKKKPTKVDSRILGFVGHDRISAADRDYGTEL